MRPGFFIILLLSIASISTASMLFWDQPKPSFSLRATPHLPITIKWGEGSEAGVPDAALHK